MVVVVVAVAAVFVAAVDVLVYGQHMRDKQPRRSLRENPRQGEGGEECT